MYLSDYSDYSGAIVANNMWGLTLCVLGGVVLVWGMNDEKLVKGVWSVDSVVPCPDEDQYRYKVEVKKTKMNRTHDWFHATFSFLDDITESSHGAHIEWCKKMDGGCKLQYQLTPTSLCAFSKEYSEINFRAILSSIGLENPECPIPQGDYELKEYLFNYADLPAESLPGQYIATAYILNQSEKVLCVMFEAAFTELEDDDE